MEIQTVFDPTFKPYGKVLEGYDTSALVRAMNDIPLPESGTEYEPDIASLEACAVYREFRDNAYGGMPIQIGMCWGRNTRLNCLEYHRDSEVNIGEDDFILLVAKADDVVDGVLDTAKVKAFKAPGGVPVEVYATTLHYAPCQTEKNGFFRVAVVLPKGTNGPKPAIDPLNGEDKTLWACNKWLLAHPDSAEAAQGAVVALTGENINIAADI